ncbi:hypothetical protein [Ramlibacter sp. AN1133]|uniref:hypothetical protein n=1 Tax=Ramlibacter sp. AN1133 TaxID=3133429 RepID=UPI0030C4203C
MKAHAFVLAAALACGSAACAAGTHDTAPAGTSASEGAHQLAADFRHAMHKLGAATRHALQRADAAIHRKGGHT